MKCTVPHFPPEKSEEIEEPEASGQSSSPLNPSVADAAGCMVLMFAFCFIGSFIGAFLIMVWDFGPQWFWLLVAILVIVAAIRIWRRRRNRF